MGRMGKTIFFSLNQVVFRNSDEMVWMLMITITRYHVKKKGINSFLVHWLFDISFQGKVRMDDCNVTEMFYGCKSLFYVL